MKRTNLVLITLLAINSTVLASDPCEVTHWELQAVDVNGTGTYEASDKVIIEGIILNNPEEMLDPTAGYTPDYQMWNLGGEWQIFIQGEGDDHAGTALWMGQNYGNLPWLHNPSLSYTDEEWLSELCRLNHDPCTGYTFAKGDRVKVTGWHKFYAGKTNINEQHSKNPAMDFEIELLEPAVGLPQPEVSTLDEVKDGNDFIFDASRLTGCEYYQARLVRINDVNIVDANDWEPDGMLTIRDANGLTFPVKLGIGAGISRFACPVGQIDVIGIFNQEDSLEPHTEGYEIWVTNYDGNGLVLADRGYKRGNLPGDINSDFKVDFEDFAELAADWLSCVAGLCDCD